MNNNTKSEENKYMLISFYEFKKICRWYNGICSKENVKCSNDTCHILRTIDENNKKFSDKIRTKKFQSELEEIIGLYE